MHPDFIMLMAHRARAGRQNFKPLTRDQFLTLIFAMRVNTTVL